MREALWNFTFGSSAPILDLSVCPACFLSVGSGLHWWVSTDTPQTMPQQILCWEIWEVFSGLEGGGRAWISKAKWQS